MRSILVIALSWFICIGQLSAQLNESDTLTYQLRVSVTGKFQTGNVSLIAIKSRTGFSGRIGNALVFKTQNKTLYQEFFRRKVDNNLDSRNFLYIHPERRFYPLAMAFISTNFRRNVDRRLLLGVGGTWNIINETNNSVKFSLSTFYEWSRFDGMIFNRESFNGDEEVELYRWAIYIAGIHRIYEQKLMLHYSSIFEPTFDDFGNSRVELDIGMDVKLWKALALSVEYQYNFEALVVSNVDQHDGILSVGLSYLFISKR